MELDYSRNEWNPFSASPDSRPALVKSSDGQHFIYVVGNDELARFEKFLLESKFSLITWLDTEERLERVEKGLILQEVESRPYFRKCETD